MVINIKEVLESMGWNDGYYIPVANKENIELEEEIERLTNQKVKLTFQFEALASKCNALEKHLKHVTTEHEENQNLLFARNSQLDSEKNLNILTKMDKERMEADIKTTLKDLDKAEERRQMKQKDLSKLVQRLDNLKLAIEWDEQVMQETENLLMKKEDDNELLLKFSHEDRKKAKELEIRRYHLQEEELARRQLAIRTSKDIDTLELILNRNVQVYKQMHEERDSLIKQWQETINHLQQRDQDTLAISREIIGVQELIEAKKEILQEEQQFLKNEKINNKELETQIDIGNTEITRLRKDLQHATHTLREYNVELAAMKREIQKIAELLQNERLSAKSIVENIEKNTKFLENIKLKVAQLREEEVNVKNSNLTGKERVKKLEELIKQEEQIQRALLLDIDNMEQNIYRSQKVYNELIDFHRIKMVKLKADEQWLTNLNHERQHIEKDLLTQKEQSYKTNFRIAILKSKLIRMSGNTEALQADRLDDFNNENKLRELEERCTEVLKLYGLLQGEIHRLEDVMRKIQAAINTDSECLHQLRDKLQTQKLLVEGAIKRRELKTNLAQQNQVDENVLKVRLKHGEKILKHEGNHIYNLQRQHIELENTLKERETDININKEFLSVKMRTLCEDNSRLSIDIQNRRVKLENYKKKLDTILSSLGKTEDGDTVTVAYLKIKSAQEKFMLQEEGDKLDSLIRKTEKEIIAMENTLKAVNYCNDSFKKTLSLVDEEEHRKEMEEIKNILYAQTNILRKNRNALHAQQDKLRELQKQLQEKDNELQEFQIVFQQKDHEFNTIKHEAKLRENKLERTDKMIGKIASKRELDPIKKKDFESHQLKDINKKILIQLSDISSKYADIKPSVDNYLQQCSLNIGSASNLTSLSHSLSSSHSSISTKSSRESIHTLALLGFEEEMKMAKETIQLKKPPK